MRWMWQGHFGWARGRHASVRGEQQSGAAQQGRRADKAERVWDEWEVVAPDATLEAPPVRGRSRVQSRPRVTNAAAAAHRAQAGAGGALGSSTAGVGAVVRLPAVRRIERAGLGSAVAVGEISPSLLHATMQAARQSGRSPEDIWEEALRDWLVDRWTTWTEARESGAARPPVQEQRRQQAWHDIEATLHALRAS